MKITKTNNQTKGTRDRQREDFREEFARLEACQRLYVIHLQIWVRGRRNERLFVVQGKRYGYLVRTALMTDDSRARG